MVQTKGNTEEWNSVNGVYDSLDFHFTLFFSLLFFFLLQRKNLSEENPFHHYSHAVLVLEHIPHYAMCMCQIYMQIVFINKWLQWYVLITIK